MKHKNVLILTVVTVAALGVAAYSLRGKGAAASSAEAALLFPELSERINDVAEVRVEKAGKSATIKREGGQWKLADRGGYPAKFEKVKELAVRVADLEIEEAKTSKKASHSKLAVEWPTTAEEGSEAGEAGLVTLRDSAGKDLAALVVGKSEWRGSKPKVYVRRASEDQVYLCSPRGTLDVMADAKSWIEPKFIELQNDRVQGVTIEHQDGERVEIARSAVNHTKFAVQNLPAAEKERYEGVANGVAQALGYGLQLEDVRPVGEVDFTKEPVARTRFRCVDGLELLVELCKFEDKNWVRVAAAYVPPPEAPKAEPAPVPEDAGESTEGAATEDGKAEEAPEEEKKDVGKEAEELNQRLAPWAFEVASYKSDVLARRMKDLVAEPAPAVDDGGLEGVMDEIGFDPETGELVEEPAAEGKAGADGQGGPEDGEGHEDVEPAPSPDDEGGAETVPHGGDPKPE
jgi:hypothetical protein